MSISLSSLSFSFTDISIGKLTSLGPSRPKIIFSATPFPNFPAAENCLSLAIDSRLVLYGSAAKFCSRFYGLKNWILENLNLQEPQRKEQTEFKSLQFKDKNQPKEHLETTPSHDGQSKGTLGIYLPNDSFEGLRKTTSQLGENSESFSEPASLSFPSDEIKGTTSQHEESSSNYQPDISARKSSSMKFNTSLQSHSSGRPPSLCIAVIGATGELARRKIFPALFALYYSGFLPENVGIFGYSRRKLTDEDLRSIIASTLTCRLDYQQDCGSKMEEFLSRTCYINGGYDNSEGMSMLNARMEQIEGESKANRIFYLSVPQEALVDIATSLADYAQTHKGWNRVIIEKPFGFDSLTSHQLTQSLLAKFKENQLYRIDHLLGRNIIENITVLRFSNLVFQPLWNRNYIHNVQVILSEDLGIQTRGRYFEGYGIIRDIVHSHLLQTIALLAMEPPISFDGEDIRNEKVKVLRSIQALERTEVVLGRYEESSENKVDDAHLNSSTPTFFAAALHIDNARWDGVPFLIKTGMGLSKHRAEIRIQFRSVPGNLYRDHIRHNADLATNELILRDVPDEAILVRVNNKIPGLGLSLDASELNLLYKDKYNVEVPDSYEHLLHDVMDGDNHLFMRSDEVTAAWDILSPILRDIDKNQIAPEQYELGSRGPVKASQLWAKHGVQWQDD